MAYDKYTKYDISFSRIVIDDLISSTYHESVKMRLSNHKQSTDLQWHIYFMMMLNACNTSALFEIYTIKAKFKDRTSSNFDRENVLALSILALKYIKTYK